VEVCADLHLLGKQFIEILSKERVSDLFEPFRLELCPKVVEDRVGSRAVLTRRTERGDRGPVGASADEDLVDVLRSDFSVVCKAKRDFLVKAVDEKVKKLVLVNFTVCLLGSRHTISKQTF
jgi:hypothetical protein